VHYLALGDSISIDYYTGVTGGGAASQLARRLQADPFSDLTRDGNTTGGVLIDLGRIPGKPDVVTLTAGGNDLLMGQPAEPILANLERIAEALDGLSAPVLLNTVYDPTDGDDDLSSEVGLPREMRLRYNALNGGIRELARRRGYLLADLEPLFHGHGVRSRECWFVHVIEPNLAGATAIAEHWHELLRKQGVVTG